jgi:hypothetical protein
MGSDEFDARRPAERQRQGCEQPQHMRGPDIHPTPKHSDTTDHVMHRLRPPFALLRWSFSPARALIQINRVIAFLGDALKADAHKEKRHCQSDRAQRDHSDGKQCLTYPSSSHQPFSISARTRATTKIGCESLPAARYACMDEAMAPQRGVNMARTSSFRGLSGDRYPLLGCQNPRA